MRNASCNALLWLTVTLLAITTAISSAQVQPELSKFAPLDQQDLADHFTGDFHYSLPLMEVPGPNGGYPIVLSYASGITPDQDASWVGLGWTLSPGAIVRQMRGVPDDFDADQGDQITTILDIEPQLTYGLGIGGDQKAKDRSETWNRANWSFIEKLRNDIGELLGFNNLTMSAKGENRFGDSLSSEDRLDLGIRGGSTLTLQALSIGTMVGSASEAISLVELNNASRIAAADAEGMVGAALDVDGQLFTGSSGRATVESLRPEVATEYAKVPLDLRSPMSHAACAEASCLTQAFEAGVNPEGGSIVARWARGVRKGELAAPCSSCSPTLDSLGVKHGAQLSPSTPIPPIPQGADKDEH